MINIFENYTGIQNGIAKTFDENHECKNMK